MSSSGAVQVQIRHPIVERDEADDVMQLKDSFPFKDT
jgi:hypothetical protein